MVKKLDLVTVFHLALILLTLIIFGLVQNLPLLSTLGFESANFFVAILSPLFFLVAASNSKYRFNTILTKETWWLFVHLGLLTLILAANGFLKMSCSEGAGLWPFLVIAFPPLLLMMSLGIVLAFLVQKTWLKFLLALLFLFAYAAYVGFLWWQDPSFRVMTHASIVMSSDLLTGGMLTLPIIGFRLSTFLLALTVIWFGIIIFKAFEDSLFSRRIKRPLFDFMVLFLLFGAHLLLHIKSIAALGLDHAALTHDYELMSEEGGLKIFADPLKTSRKEADAILEEARYYQYQLKKRLGQIDKTPLTIWLHHSDQEKFLYTGALNVHFALPMLREVHISGAHTPHGVLGHELAHIYVGEHTKSMFGIPMSYFFVPNLALTEGIACALTEELNIRNNLTLMEQAQSMHKAGIRVDINDLFHKNPLYFSSSDPKVSYVYAGAFIKFILQQFPENERSSLLQKLIKTADLKAIFNNDYEQNLHLLAFMKKLDEPIPVNRILWAEQRFKTTSILTADCSEKSRLDNWHLKRAIINQDLMAINSFVEQLPLIDQPAALKKIGGEILLSGNFAHALSIIDVALARTMNQAMQAEISLSALDAHINLNHYREALALISSINDEFFFDAQKRLLLLTKIFLQDVIDEGNHRELSLACLKFLFSKTDEQATKFAKVAYQMGRNAKNSDERHPVVLAASYVVLRYFYNASAFLDIKMPITLLLKSADVLPDLVRHETLIMAAVMHKGLKENTEALKIYRFLLHQKRSEGESIILEDAIDRLLFVGH